MPGAPGFGPGAAAMTKKEAAAVATAPKRAERESPIVSSLRACTDQSDTDDSSLSRSGMCMTLPTCHALLVGWLLTVAFRFRRDGGVGDGHLGGGRLLGPGCGCGPRSRAGLPGRGLGVRRDL